MKTPHKHAELIKAWADGHEIQVKLLRTNRWEETPDPSWNYEYEYRIKPEPKPDTVSFLHLCKGSVGLVVSTCFTVNNLKITWDGETGKLKSAEVIK